MKQSESFLSKNFEFNSAFFSIALFLLVKSVKSDPESQKTAGIYSLNPMEPKNRLSEIFADLGLAEVRIAKDQLDRWGMTANRFNQLVSNTARLGMTVGEARFLREWLQKNFKGRNACLFPDELPQPGPGVQQALPMH